jgi:hypothetical protein
MRTAKTIVTLAAAAIALPLAAARAYDWNDPDRYAHPRSVEEYRKIVPKDDTYGMCRSAGHLKKCLAWLKSPVKPAERMR